MNMRKAKIDLGNGGIVFTVTETKIESRNTKIPTLNINAEMFGHKMNGMEIRITPDRLIELGKFLSDEGEKAKEYYNDSMGVWGGSANSKFRID